EVSTRGGVRPDFAAPLAVSRTEVSRVGPAPAALPLYFVNWWVDAALVGGLSIAAWLVIAAFAGADSKPILVLSLILALLFNCPHFSATLYRLYQSPEHIRQFPVTACGLPFVMLGAVFACFWLPQTVAPYFLMLYVLWSPYHYSGQTV